MNDITRYQYYETSIYSIGVPENYFKLIKRIQSSLNISPTVGNIIKLSPHEFQNTKGVGKRYFNELVNLQSILPELLDDFHSKSENELVSLHETNSESDTTQNNKKCFIDEFKSLYSNIELKIREIQKLTFDCLQEQNKTGLVETINAELVKINQSLQTIFSISTHSFNALSIPDSVYLNYYFFDLTEIKALRKLESYLMQDIDVKSLLILDLDELHSQKGFGTKTTDALRNVINLVKTELTRNSFEKDQQNLKRNILVPINDIKYKLEALDIVILEDIESYLLTLNEQDMDIAMRRWGFHHVEETLEQIGFSHNTSRERIRQLETLINNRITKYLRIHPAVLWRNFQDYLSPELPLKLSTLESCFSSHKSFYQFLEICFKLEKGTIINSIIPEVSKNIFDKYFTMFPSPVSDEELFKWLISENVTEDISIASNYLLILEEYGVIQRTTEGFVPRALNQGDAVAHVLIKHPAGLPWQDVTRIVNINKYSKNKISERRIPGQMFDNEYVYLSDRGTYRHVKYANFEGIDIEALLLDIIYFFDETNDKSLHLYTDYFQQRHKHINIDYYSLRYIVRNHGEKHGIYFVGQSHVDTVSLNPNPDRVTLKDAILNTLKNSDKSLTIAEIAQDTRSRNQILTFYTIQALQQEEKVVRVDQKLYTTPEKVFQSIDRQNVLIEINKIIQSTSRIIESDVFREQINAIFNYSYSKYFYASLASIHQKPFLWHCKNQFFCKKPFLYKSMSEIMNEKCKLQVGQEENITEVQKLIWLTKQTASSAFHNWKSKQQSMQSTEINEQNVEPDA